jgi:hypothetical protein
MLSKCCVAPEDTKDRSQTDPELTCVDINVYEFEFPLLSIFYTLWINEQETHSVLNFPAINVTACRVLPPQKFRVIPETHMTQTQSKERKRQHHNGGKV